MAGSNISKTDNRAVNDSPLISERQWYVLAITSAILTGIAILFSFLWIFGDGFDGDGDLKKAQALSPFGVALFAVVTFCTAGWRGSINTRQADQAESEGRAKLLQEGAKLLGENGKAAHVSAGVATLGVLVSGQDKGYAYQAMNLLADYVEDHMRYNHLDRHRPEISGVMRNGVANGVNTGRDISFYYEEDEQDPEPQPSYWHFIPGFDTIYYHSGIFDKDPHYELDELVHVALNRVDVTNWRRLRINQRFTRCRFINCGISLIEALDCLYQHRDYHYAFTSCDFSGCVIHPTELLRANLKEQKNYYIKGNPPVLIGSNGPVDWEEILICRDRN